MKKRFDQKRREFFEKAKAALKVLSGTPRAVKLVWDANPFLTFSMMAINISMGSFPLINLWLIKMLTDEITRSATALGSFRIDLIFQSLSSFHILHLLIWISVIHILEGVSAQLAGYVELQLGDILSMKMNERILRKANSFPDLSLFESAKFYDSLTKAEREAGYRPMQILHQGLSILRGAVQFLTMTISFFFFQPILALMVMIFSIPHMYIRIKHDRENYSNESYLTPERRRMYYFSSLLTNNYSAKEVRMFGLGDYFFDRYMELFESSNKSREKIRRKQAFQNVLLATMASISQAAAYGFIAVQAALGMVSLGTFTFFTSALAQLESQLLSIIWSMSGLYESNLYLNNLFDFLEIEPEMKLPDPTWAFDAPRPIQQGIEFRNVSFVYPGTETQVFEDLNLTFNSGECVALVGENGAGKTTIVKLLGRLYDPSSGSIHVDGINLKDLDLMDWRQNVAVIFQDHFAYHMTAMENIGLGQINFIDDENRVKSAAEKGGASAVIEKLPEGYHTMLGRYFQEDKGADLSGGEWQKIALSRAFMRSPDSNDDGSLRAAQLLILDEPTASLDVQSEHDIYQRFKNLTRGKTTILISHRFSTVKMADRILLLDKGKILEDGSHEELMALGGEYASLFKMQADKYL